MATEFVHAIFHSLPCIGVHCQYRVNRTPKGCVIFGTEDQIKEAVFCVEFNHCCCIMFTSNKNKDSIPMIEPTAQLNESRLVS